jgi:hypothetical protein
MPGIAVLAVLSAGIVFAQASLGTGAAGGTVHDSSGAVIAGARVTLTEGSKNLVRTGASDESGTFLFPSVGTGIYSVLVEKPRFKAERIEDLTIDVGERISLDVTLQVGEVRSAVTVQAPTPTELQAESNTIGPVVSAARVQELPLNGRNFLQLALLAGGANEVSAASDLFSSNVGPPARTIVLPGTLPYAASYSLDGMNIRGARDGDMALSPSVTAIDEFRVQESFLMPDQGVGVAVVNVVTKSGGNEFHGEAYEFLRNRELDARSFFAASREDLKRNQFGAAIGGPVRRNRVWFHGFYEGLRELTAFSVAGYSPTAAMFGGDFQETGRTIYDPMGYTAASGKRTPFPGDVIPGERINTVAKNLLGYYQPGSSLASSPINVTGTPKETLADDQGGVRMDAALSSRHELFGRYFRQRTPSAQPGLYPLSGLSYINGSDLAMVQDVWTATPHAVNTLRIGFLRNDAFGGNEGAGKGPILPEIGITNTIDEDGVSRINLQRYSGFGRAAGDVGNHDNTWQLDDEFTYAKGSHSFALGIGLRYRRGWHLNGNSGALGQLNFQSAFTAELAPNAQGQFVPVANTGDSFADFLLGMPVSGILVGLPVAEFRSTQAIPFFQDSWRAGRNLTLNYGVSWFLETPPDPQGWAANAVHGFNTTTGLLTYAGLGQVDRQLVKTDRNNFAPRLGLAWQPRGLGSTIVRAGAGLYYSEFPWVFAPYSFLFGSPTGIPGRSFTNPLTNPQPAYVMGVNVFPPAPAGGLTADYAANLPAGTMATILDPNYRSAYVSQWNIAVQHGFGLNDTFEVSYLGSSGHRLPNVIDLSQCRPAGDLFCNPNTKPWPRYSLLLTATSSGNSSYEAMVARYEHRMSRGLNLSVEYTVGKALTDSWQAALSIYDQISSCRECSKGPANFDVRQRAVGSAVWELPFGRGRRFGTGLPGWTDAIAGNWRFTAITTFASGAPVFLAAPNQTGSVLINPLPNRVCDGRNGNLSGNIRSNGFLWFDPACFLVPGVGYFGNSGPTVLDGPGINNWDIGIEKSFPVRERARVQLRAEMFNAWNHAQFGQPDGNSGDGPNFGRISSVRPPRLIQLAAKLEL